MRYTLVLLVLVLSNLSYAGKGDKLITLEDLYRKNTFSMKSVPGFNAMKDGLHYTKLETKDKAQTINIYRLSNDGWVSTVFNSKSVKVDGKKVRFYGYHFSDDETKLLINSEPEPVYRHSTFYKTYVYDIAHKRIEQLADEKVLHATFSPDGSKVAYVLNNDLHYKDLATGKVTHVTIDGEWLHPCFSMVARW